MSSTSSLLCSSPETVQNIRKYYDLDKPEKLDEVINIFEDWIKMQRHFRKKDYNRNFLEMLIIQSKGSLERAKSLLDKYCTLKTMLPKYFEKTDPKRDFEAFHNTYYCGLLPKLVGDYNRICFVKLYSSKNLSMATVLDFYRYTIMMVEYILTEDYINGLILVFDYLDINLTDLLAAMNPVEANEAMKLYTECFGLRLKGFHFVTPSKMIHGFVTLLKQVFSQKLADRIHIHKDVDSLFKVLPREVFPEEYGGEERPIKAIRDDWIEALRSEKAMRYIQNMREATTNEEHRDKYEFNSIYMGLPGTFRTLSVD